MILVTLGTLHFPFDRLLRALDTIPPDEELLVQTRAGGAAPPRAQVVAELPYDELVEQVRRARVVVCHAGVGSVLTAVGNGKRPVVVPRLRSYGEAVDDHQLPFARRLAAAELVTLVEDVSALAPALEADAHAPPQPGGSRLALDLRELLEGLVYSR